MDHHPENFQGFGVNGAVRRVHRRQADPWGEQQPLDGKFAVDRGDDNATVDGFFCPIDDQQVT